MPKYIKLHKEYKDLEPIVKTITQYIKICEGIDEAKDILKKEKDTELREFAKIDLEESLPIKDELESDIKILLIPKDPDDMKNAVVEIRAGTGGDEASIFAGDLFDSRSYQRQKQLTTLDRILDLFHKNNLTYGDIE